jgi:septal ring factor EnvC (AmiA/AmiB activator)
MTRALVAIFALVLSAQSGFADAVDTARDAARNLTAATVALSEAERASDRVAALTQTIQAYEEGLSALRDGLRTAALREGTLHSVYQARTAEVAQLLGVLMSIEQTDGPFLLLHPAGPLGTARAGMLVADITPALAAQVATLQADLQEMTDLRSVRENAAGLLQDGLQAIQAARSELSRAISDRSELPRRLGEDMEVLRTLLVASDTLDAFAQGLAANALPAGDSPVRSFIHARGNVRLPVRGVVLRAANEPDAAGVRRPGILLATGPGALVTAPWSATVRYLGPLLDYGNVIILEPAEGYLMVLAGLEVVYGGVGDVVPDGAALGLMPQTGVAQNIGGQTEQALASATDRRETLYLELRENGNTVDPSGWFALSGARN